MGNYVILSSFSVILAIFIWYLVAETKRHKETIRQLDCQHRRRMKEIDHLQTIYTMNLYRTIMLVQHSYVTYGGMWTIATKDETEDTYHYVTPSRTVSQFYILPQLVGTKWKLLPQLVGTKWKLMVDANVDHTTLTAMKQDVTLHKLAVAVIESKLEVARWESLVSLKP